MARIESAHDLHRSLLASAPEWGGIIALRAAMRVLPLAAPSLNEQHSDVRWLEQEGLFLGLLRSVATSWIATKYPDLRAMEKYVISGRINSLIKEAENNNIPNASYFASRAVAVAVDTVKYIVVDEATRVAAVRSAVNAAEAAARVIAAASDADTADPSLAVTFSAIDADFEWLRRNSRSRRLLVDQPLWLSGEQTAELEHLLRRYWTSAARRLRSVDPNWKVWTEWYSARISGRRPKTKEIENFRVNLNGEADWAKGPVHVNRLIAEKIVELENIKISTKEVLPKPPSPRAASIEPRVVEGKITVPSTVAEVTFDSETMAALLRATSNEIIALSADIRGEPQFDARAVEHLDRVSAKLGMGRPTHADFFSVCLEYEILKGYRGKVAAEWPDIFAVRYSAIVGTLKSAVDKFPPWREFTKDHSDDEDVELTPEQMEVLRTAASITIEELREPTNSDFVDPSTPEAIEKLAEDFSVALAEANGTTDPLPLRLSVRAKDFVESLANTAKRFAELGVAKAGELAAPVGRFAKRTSPKMADGFVDELEKSLVKIAKDAGKNAPYAIWRFMNRAFAGGVGGMTLATAFPAEFGWLTGFLVALGAGVAPAVLPRKKKSGKEVASSEDGNGADN